MKGGGRARRRRSPRRGRAGPRARRRRARVPDGPAGPALKMRVTKPAPASIAARAISLLAPEWPSATAMPPWLSRAMAHDASSATGRAGARLAGASVPSRGDAGRASAPCRAAPSTHAWPWAVQGPAKREAQPQRAVGREEVGRANMQGRGDHGHAPHVADSANQRQRAESPSRRCCGPRPRAGRAHPQASIPPSSARPRPGPRGVRVQPVSITARGSIHAAGTFGAPQACARLF